MEFSFDVDPDFDVAIGTEISFEEIDAEFEIEEFSTLGVDPKIPTPAKPGSEDKVRMLAARYAAGLPLWHDEDCYDHGPAESANFESHHDHLEDDDF